MGMREIIDFKHAASRGSALRRLLEHSGSARCLGSRRRHKREDADAILISTIISHATSQEEHGAPSMLCRE